MENNSSELRRLLDLLETIEHESEDRLDEKIGTRLKAAFSMGGARQEALGQLDREELAKKLLNQYRNWLGKTGQKANKDSLANFFIKDVGFDQYEYNDMAVKFQKDRFGDVTSSTADQDDQGEEVKDVPAEEDSFTVPNVKGMNLDNWSAVFKKNGIDGQMKAQDWKELATKYGFDSETMTDDDWKAIAVKNNGGRPKEKVSVTADTREPEPAKPKVPRHVAPNDKPGGATEEQATLKRIRSYIPSLKGRIAGLERSAGSKPSKKDADELARLKQKLESMEASEKRLAGELQNIGDSYDNMDNMLSEASGLPLTKSQMKSFFDFAASYIHSNSNSRNDFTTAVPQYTPPNSTPVQKPNDGMSRSNNTGSYNTENMRKWLDRLSVLDDVGDLTHMVKDVKSLKGISGQGDRNALAAVGLAFLKSKSS